MWCYRRFGHNEGDEPSFTQPQMYAAIKKHPPISEIYGKRLISEGVVDQAWVERETKDYIAHLEQEFEAAVSYLPNKADWFEGRWAGLGRPEEPVLGRRNIQTAIGDAEVERLGQVLTTVPAGFNIHKTLQRILDAKKQMFESGEGFDWATAEALAYGSLLAEGQCVRLSGQDSGRGTFSQRHASFESGDTVKVGDRTVRAKNIVIATGSSVTPLPGVEIDEKIVVSSTGALELEKVPEHLVVIGGGVIGLELGSVWRRVGARVTCVEFLDQILPGFDDDVRKEANKIFKKQGVEFKLGTKVTGVTVDGGKARLTVEPAKGGAVETIEADAVLVSIGRRPNTEGLALDKAGLQANQRGQIETDHDFRTSVKGIWAIGDVIPGPMLAHKAEDEGIAVAENIAGLTGIVNHDVIPSVVYTMRAIAGTLVGRVPTEV